MKKQSFHNTILKAMLLKKQHYKKIIKYMKKQKYKNKKNSGKNKNTAIKIAKIKL